MSTPIRLGLLIGSYRTNGNNRGIASWVEKVVDAHLNAPDSPKKFEIVPIDPVKTPLPFGPVVDGSAIPAQITDVLAYPSPGIQEWSRFVSSCAGFIVVTPQYNGGYPGELKNAIDHIYNEWAGKAIMIVAFGGHGGGKCALQLSGVFSHIKSRVVPDPVCISLPRQFITGQERVPLQGQYPEFLEQYVEPVNVAADKLKSLTLGEDTQETK